MANHPMTGSLVTGFSKSKRQVIFPGTDKPDCPELHNGLLYRYEGTNITGEKVVNHYKTQLNDALNESYVGLNS